MAGGARPRGRMEDGRVGSEAHLRERKGRAPAAFRARRRARASLDECACALCEEPLRDVQHRSYEIINPWLRCHACERFVHARCAKAARVAARERRSARFVCGICRMMEPKRLAF